MEKHGTSETIGSLLSEEIAKRVSKAPSKVYPDQHCCIDFTHQEFRCGDFVDNTRFKGYRAKFLEALIACKNYNVSSLELGYYLASTRGVARKDVSPKSAKKKSHDTVSDIRSEYCERFCGDKYKCIRSEGDAYCFSPSQNFRVLEAAALTAQFSGVQDEDEEDPRLSYVESVLPCGYYRDRPELTELLNRAFSNHARIHVIYGEHGTGKSELARAFAITCNHGNRNIRPALQYKYLYFTACAPGGLRETIASLPASGLFEADRNLYTEKLRLLSDTEKPCLLVIDNCNNPSAEDFASDSPVYRDLLATGCHVLITSRQNMEHQYGFPQTSLKTMRLSDLSELFCSISGQDIKETDPRLQVLIETLLHHNPHLVVLAAKLAQVRPLNEIIAALQTFRAGEIDDVIDTMKDRGQVYACRFIDHGRKLFDLDRQELQPLEWKILFNLMLPPPSGVPQAQFIFDAFAPEEHNEVRQTLMELRYRNLVLLHNQKLMLPGLLRELLLEKFSAANMALVERYLCTIDRQIHVEIHHDQLEPYMELAAGCEILQNVTPVSVTYALLISDLASDYALLELHEKAYDFAKLAADLLDRICAQSCSREEQISIAVAYNNTGYAVYRNRRYKDAASLAERVFRQADQLVSLLLTASSEDGLRLVRLQAKIHGNMGAALLARKEYAQALDMHLRGVSFREELFQEHPTQEVALLLATAYRAVASAYYFHSTVCNPNAALEKLIQSCQYHQKAIRLYDAQLDPAHHETIIAYNRYAGAFCAALAEWVCKAPQEQPDAPFLLDPYATLVSLMDQMHLSIKMLIEHFPDNRELVNCIKNTQKLLSVAKQVHYTNRDFVDKAHAISGLLQDLPYIDAYSERDAAFERLDQTLNQFEELQNTE